jgi:hypothetical protein
MGSHCAEFIIGHLMLAGSLYWMITESKLHHNYAICQWTLGKLMGMTFYERSQIKAGEYVCQAAMKFVPIKMRFAGIDRTFFTNK